MAFCHHDRIGLSFDSPECHFVCGSNFLQINGFPLGKRLKSASVAVARPLYLEIGFVRIKLNILYVFRFQYILGTLHFLQCRLSVIKIQIKYLSNLERLRRNLFVIFRQNLCRPVIRIGRLFFQLRLVKCHRAGFCFCQNTHEIASLFIRNCCIGVRTLRRCRSRCLFPASGNEQTAEYRQKQPHHPFVSHHAPHSLSKTSIKVSIS